MDHTGFVCSLQRLGDLLGYRQGFVDGDRSLCDAISQRWPLDQLQHQRTGALRLFKAMDLSDIRMVEACKNLRLSLEPSEAIRISGERLGQNLQRHLPVQLGIGGLIDLAHTPLADEGGHVIVAESGTDGQGHRLRMENWGHSMRK